MRTVVCMLEKKPGAGIAGGFRQPIYSFFWERHFMELTNLNLNKDRNKLRRKPSVDLSTMLYGKVPPQAKELEEAVLGAIMLEKSAFDTVVEILKPECFYVDGHQKVYRAMLSLAQKSQP